MIQKNADFALIQQEKMPLNVPVNPPIMTMDLLLNVNPVHPPV